MPILLSQVCSKSCSQEAKHCDELDAWSLRLDTELIANAAFVDSVQPSESSNVQHVAHGLPGMPHLHLTAQVVQSATACRTGRTACV